MARHRSPSPMAPSSVRCSTETVYAHRATTSPKDDMVIMASEVGVLDVEPENVLVKERLHPGRIFLVDTRQGRIIDDEEIKSGLASAHPYAEWLAKELVHIDDGPRGSVCRASGPRNRSAASAGLRLHRGGPEYSRRSNGPKRVRTDRIHGHRYGPRRALGQVTSALRLLSAAVRPGDQPAARRDPRGARDGYGLDAWLRAQSAGSRTGVVSPDQDRRPGS